MLELTYTAARRALALICLTLSVPLWASDFSVPLDDLRQWSQHVIVNYNVNILGHSKVHKVSADCEMHFGARSSAYHGEPDGFVLEPMNLCVEPFGNKPAQADKDWIAYGESLKGSIVRAEGVPRIWPEHLVGGGDSNPDHAVELHPITKLQRGNEVMRFEKFIYAPDGFSGGLSEDTANKILTDLEVSVRNDHGSVEINFQAGRIGNFSTLTVSISPETIVEVEGSYRMDGEVVVSSAHHVPVHLVTVAGTDINTTIGKLRGKKNKKVSLDCLVLFSLDPAALYKAAQQSNGVDVSVPNPIQLILFGEPSDDQ